MKIKLVQVTLTFALVALGIVACGRASGLKGQSNTTITFYGEAKDQDGNPLDGVAFDFRVEAYPKDWTFDTRGRDKDVRYVSARSDVEGRLSLVVEGCEIIRMKAEKQGYRSLEDTDVSDGAVNNRFFHLISWSDLCYRSDPKHPAVFVFVKDGVREVSALPCKGGFDSGNGRDWRLNKPGWPREPSLDDVDWKDGQPRKNVQVPLVLKAIDTEGRPLPGVDIFPEVERYRSLAEMRRDSHYATVRTSKEQLTAKTDFNGLAHVTANGFRLIEVRTAWNTCLLRPDYYALEFMDNKGNAIYRCDESNPMVLVIANPDTFESHVMPCRGGYELRDGQWQRTAPTWPDGLTKIVYRRPTTLPASTISDPWAEALDGPEKGVTVY